MSYCVRCGVELDNSAAKCALCNTPVVIPEEGYGEKASPPYPDRIAIPPTVRKRYLAFLISVIMMIPNAVCLIINFFMPNTGRWSVYVISSSLFVWLVAVWPLSHKKIQVYKLLAADTVGALAYAYVFFWMFRENGWYFKLAVPFILSLSLFAFIFAFWYKRKKRSMLQVIIILLADVAVFSFIADGLIHRYYGVGRMFFAALIVSVSCVGLMIFFRETETNKRFKAWLTRRFYF